MIYDVSCWIYAVRRAHQNTACNLQLRTGRCVSSSFLILLRYVYRDHGCRAASPVTATVVLTFSRVQLFTTLLNQRPNTLSENFIQNSLPTHQLLDYTQLFTSTSKGHLIFYTIVMRFTCIWSNCNKNTKAYIITIIAMGIECVHNTSPGYSICHQKSFIAIGQRCRCKVGKH